MLKFLLNFLYAYVQNMFSIRSSVQYIVGKKLLKILEHFKNFEAYINISVT